MSALTVDARGQVTFSTDVLQHLGIKPGEPLKLTLLPGGRVQLRAVQHTGTFRDLYGILEGKTNGARLSIEQIDDATGKTATSENSGSKTC